MLLIIALILDLAGAFAVARFLRRRTNWIGGVVALVAALPVPLLLGVLAAAVAGYGRLMKSVDGQPMELVITIGIGVIALYVAGLVAAAFSVRPGRPPTDRVDVADIFK